MMMEPSNWEIALEVIILAAAPWPLLRLLMLRPFRRALPRYVWAGGGLIAGYAVIVVAISFAWPLLLRPLALGAAAAMLWMWFRARPNYGASKNLPPGSLELLPVEPWIDDLFFLKLAQQYGPVFKSRQFLRPMVSVVGIERARAIFRRYDSVAIHAPLRQYAWLLPCPFMRNMDRGTHEKYRPLFRRAFSLDAVRQCEPGLNRIALDTLRSASVESASASDGGVSPMPYLRVMTYKMLIRLMFGFEPESEEFAKLNSLYQVVEPSLYRRASQFLPAGRRRSSDALREVKGIIQERAVHLAAQLSRGEEPPPSFLCEMVRADVRVTDDEVALFNLSLLAGSGTIDAAALLLWILKVLCENPAWGERLREALESGAEAPSDTDGLANRIVMETLRLHQSERLDRKVVENIEVDGFTVPKGWLLRIRVRESHRDPDVFEDPHTFNPDRFLDFGEQATEFAPLGILNRSCIGDHATKAMSRALVRGLVTGYDNSIVAGGPDEPVDWHWGPSRDLRVRLPPRT